PPGGARFDENTLPPWTRGDFGGGLDAATDPPRRCAPPLRRRGFSVHDRCRFAFFPPFGKGNFQSMGEFLAGLQGSAKPVGGNMVFVHKTQTGEVMRDHRTLLI